MLLTPCTTALPTMISSRTPATPTTSPTATTITSSSSTPSDSSTTLSAGGVSSPVNGGARNAPAVPPSTSNPYTELLTRLWNRNLSRGRDGRSSLRISFISPAKNRCCLVTASSSLHHFCGCQIMVR